MVSTTVSCLPVTSQLFCCWKREEGGGGGGGEDDEDELDATAPYPYVCITWRCLLGVEDFETRTRALGPPIAKRSLCVLSKFFHSSAITVAGFNISKLDLYLWMVWYLITIVSFDGIWTVGNEWFVAVNGFNKESDERFNLDRSWVKRVKLGTGLFCVIDVCSVVVFGRIFGEFGGEWFDLGDPIEDIGEYVVFGGGGIGGGGAWGNFRVFGEDDAARFVSI